MKSGATISILIAAAAVVYVSMPSRREPECVMDHTLDMTIEENIQFHRYPHEKHKVLTEDGFYLNLIRLPRNDSDRLPVLIVHGFMSSSRAWVAMGPNASLGYKLYDAGYDVWLADLRGNEYSLEHNTLKKTDPKFWEFSIHEMGLYDQPALVDFILNKTGAPKLIHIGYSMGSGSFFVMNALHPEFTHAKVQAHIAMAPGVFFKHSTSIYWKIHWLFIMVNKRVGDFGSEGAYGHGLMQSALQGFCTHNTVTKLIGKLITSGITGPSDSFNNETIYMSVVKNGLIGSSVRTAEHFLQMHLSGKFRQFDYGSAENNMQHYGQATPPLYDLSRTTVPVHLFHGSTDAVCSPKDVETLTSLLQNLKSKTLINESTFNHADFFIGNKAVTSLNPKLEEILESVSGNGRTSEVTEDENTISCNGTNVNLVEKSSSTNVSGSVSTDDASSMNTIENCKSIRQNKNNSDL
nr:PREDICTED: gastric triacylglycerol lipase-like [Bemisia tabaci]